MKDEKIVQLLHQYFEGETTLRQERELEAYFRYGEVAEELKKYTGLFTGIKELSEPGDEGSLDKDIMDYIVKNDGFTKKKWLWQSVSEIAASVIFIVGGLYLFRQDKLQYTDTFDNPEVAYAYAKKTLLYVSEKYNQGLAGLTSFKKLQTANENLQRGIMPVYEYLEMVNQLNSGTVQNQKE